MIQLYEYIRFLSSEGNLCGGQINQSIRYVHSCSQPIFLIPMSANNPCQKSVVPETSAKPSMGCQYFGLVWQKIQEPLTQRAKVHGVVNLLYDWQMSE